MLDVLYGRSFSSVRTSAKDGVKLRPALINYRLLPGGAAQARVEDVSQRVAEEVEREHDEADRDARER